MWILTETLDLNLHNFMQCVAATWITDGIISRFLIKWSVSAYSDFQSTQNSWFYIWRDEWESYLPCFQRKAHVSESGTWLNSSWQECHCSQEEVTSHHPRGPAAWGWPHSYCVPEDSQKHFNSTPHVRIYYIPMHRGIHITLFACLIMQCL